MYTGQVNYFFKAISPKCNFQESFFFLNVHFLKIIVPGPIIYYFLVSTKLV